jgi:anti-sigma factor RsiW
MHDVVTNELESYLSGDLDGSGAAVRSHLAECEECRRELGEIESISAAIRELRADPIAVPAPPLGFYNRVANRIVESQYREAWGLFSPGVAFFRKIAFASLLMLAGLGGFLATRTASSHASEAAPLASRNPVQIMADHDPTVVHEDGADRDRMMVTLATYRQ